MDIILFEFILQLEVRLVTQILPDFNFDFVLVLGASSSAVPSLVPTFLFSNNFKTFCLFFSFSWIKEVDCSNIYEIYTRKNVS